MNEKRKFNLDVDEGFYNKSLIGELLEATVIGGFAGNFYANFSPQHNKWHCRTWYDFDNLLRFGAIINE